MSRQSQAALAGAAGFLVAFGVVYLVAHLLFDLMIVLTAIGAGGIVAIATYNHMLGRPYRELPWERRRR